MSSKRMFFVMLGAFVLLIGLIGGSIYFGNQLLVQSSTKLNDLRLETAVIDEQQNSLAQARKDIEKYEDLETIAKTVVPQEKDQALTVREIVKFGEETNVPITNITFPTSELGETKPKGTGSAATSPVSQATPVTGIPGLYQLEVTISNDQDNLVSYPALINFLKKLEQNRRTSQVSNVGIQPDLKNRTLLTYTMTINVYIKP